MWPAPPPLCEASVRPLIDEGPLLLYTDLNNPSETGLVDDAAVWEARRTATGARRSLLAGGALEREEDVGLVGIHFNGEFWPFPEVEWTVAPWGAWRVTASYADRGTSCTIEAETDDEGCAVRVPSKSGMVDGARETYRGTLRVTMFDKGRGVVSATTRHACLETGGEFDAEWAAASAMTALLPSCTPKVLRQSAISPTASGSDATELTEAAKSDGSSSA